MTRIILETQDQTSCQFRNEFDSTYEIQKFPAHYLFIKSTIVTNYDRLSMRFYKNKLMGIDCTGFILLYSRHDSVNFGSEK
jgi:hypothetical protein